MQLTIIGAGTIGARLIGSGRDGLLGDVDRSPVRPPLDSQGRP